MSLIVTGLTDYAKAEGFPLIAAAVTKGTTANYVNIVSGLKGAGLVPFMDSTVTLSVGGTCSFTNNGTSTFSEVELGVKPIEYMESICIGALEGKAMMYEVAGYEELPYAQTFLEMKSAQISKGLDQLYWLGDVSGGDAFDGFTVQGASKMNTVATATTSVYEAVDAAIDAAVAADSSFETSDNVAIFMNYAKFRELQKELVAKNFFHYNPNEIKENQEILFPGTKMKVIATEGLAGHDFLYVADVDHLHIGTSLQSEAEGMTVYHDMISNNLYLRAQWYNGTGVSKAFFQKAC